MELFPGKVVTIKNKKEMFRTLSPHGMWIYTTTNGESFICNIDVADNKILIINMKKTKHGCYKSHEIVNFFSSCNDNKDDKILDKLYYNICNFENKKVYLNYLNKIDKGRIKCFISNDKDIGNDLYRIETEEIVLPFIGSANLRNFDNFKKRIYPACAALFPKKQNTTEKDILYKKGIFYKTIPLPIKYKGNLVELKYLKDINFILYCYGFVDIEKWHFGVLNHYLIQKKFNYSKLPSICQNVVKEKQKSIEEKKEGIGNCNVIACIKSNSFLDCQNIIRNYMKDYLKKAVTFFENERTKKKMRGYYIDEKKFGKSAMKFEILAYQNLDILKYKILILRGISYNWDSNSPSIHCNFITYYNSNRPPKWSSDEFPMFECKILKLKKII